MEKAVKKWQGVILALVVLVSFGISGEVQAASDTWVPVGGKDFVSTGGWGTVNIAFRPTTNEPYIEYMDWSKGGIAIKKFNGSGWETVGNANFNSNGFEQASIAFSPESSEVYVAYSDGNSHKATVRRYDGSQWVPVGNTNFTSSEALSIKLVFNPATKKPYVAYRNYAGKITVQGYDGSQWVPVGNVNLNANGAYNVSLTFDPGNGQPYVGYSEWSNSGVINGGISVKRLEGSQWVTAGNTNFNPTGTTNVDLAFNPTSKQPYIAYGDWTRGEITVKKLDGTQWTNVGGSNFNGGGAFNVHLAFNQLTGEPYVAYNNSNNLYKLSVKKFDGSQWSTVGNANFSPDQTYQSNIAFNPAINQPYVIGNDGGGITVMKYGDGKPYNINSSKSSYKNEEDVVFNWAPSISSSDLKKYKITVYKKYENLLDWLSDPFPRWYFNLSGTTKNIGRLSVGNYYARIEPQSVLDSRELSNAVNFSVERIPVPGPVSNTHPTKREYGVGENVIIKWVAAENATEYQVNIFNLLDPMIAERTVITRDLKFETKFPKGDYTVTVQARNSSGYGPRGDSKPFEVTDRDDPVFPVKDALKSDGSLNGWYASTYWQHDIFGGYQRGAIDLYQSGCNAKGEGNAKGKDVYAVQDGEVWSKTSTHLVIKHKIPLILNDENETRIDEWYSQYGHMSDQIAEFDKKGNRTKVYKDTSIIGKISNVGAPSGRCGNYHLHFFMSKEVDYCGNFSKACFDTAISPYWLHGTYSANKSLYADDLKETRVVESWEDPKLYDKVIFLNPPSYPADIDKGKNIK